MEITTFSTFTNEDVFVCGQCKSVFTSLIIYLDHKKSPCNVETVRIEYSVNRVPTEICVVGDDVLNNCESYQITNNYEVTNPVEQYLCTVCQKSFKKYKSLELHKKTHSGDKSFQCPVCGRCFIQVTHLQRHLPSHKVWPEGLGDTTPKTTIDELLSYSCPYCDATLANYGNFRLHLKEHVALKKFKCIQNDCVNLYDNLEMLLKHVKQDHITAVFTCHVCTNTFTSLQEIASHQQEHPKNDRKCVNKYKCTQCDATFRSNNSLTLHMSTDNHNKSCIHCNKVFASAKRLRLHLQTHRNVKPFHCQVCGVSFNVKKYLDSHMLRHGERQHVCNICDLKFKRRDLLGRHMRTHQGIKKIQCPYREKLDCKMEFTRSDKLNLHVKTHLNKLSNK